jgi:hypothetical protein
MPDEPLEVLVVCEMRDGTFAAVARYKKLRVVQDGFKRAEEAVKFMRILCGMRCHQGAQVKRSDCASCVDVRRYLVDNDHLG